MDVKILNVHNHGNQNEEYVFIEVLEDCDIGEYMLADSTYTQSGKISNKVRHTYWFPDKKVKKGEFVSLWTCKGENTEGKTKGGSKIHRFYWGLDSSVWNDEGDCALLFHVAEYSDHRAK